MGWKNIFSREPRHIRRIRGYLQEARLAMIEHRIAAEHYQASADMYAKRVRRLEQELAAWEAGLNPHADIVQSTALMPGKQPNTVRAETESPGTASAPVSVGIIRAA